MAQPPDRSEIFLREVDENLRRDQMRDFARKYGSLLIGLLVLFLAAAGGWIYWKYDQQKRSERQVEQLAEIYRNIGSGNLKAAPGQLDQLSASGQDAVRASALFTRAAIAVEQRDLKRATDIFRQVANDGGLPKPYRDLALIRQTALEFDRLNPQEVITRLQPLAKPDSPWFGSAAELTAVALIKQGKKQQAGRLFAAIARNKTVPDALRGRSVQIAGSLGVDASAAMPAPAQ